MTWMSCFKFLKFKLLDFISVLPFELVLKPALRLNSFDFHLLNFIGPQSAILKA